METAAHSRDRPSDDAPHIPLVMQTGAVSGRKPTLPKAPRPRQPQWRVFLSTCGTERELLAVASPTHVCVCVWCMSCVNLMRDVCFLLVHFVRDGGV